MPIIIPEGLPARSVLESEGVSVMDSTRAEHQDIRPLEIALLNLMPNKIPTETQIARLLGSTALQVQLTLVTPNTHIPKNTSQEHLQNFYHTWNKIRDRFFDGFIVTGAPVEHLPFEKVRYWKELQEIFAWSRQQVFSTFCICWGAQAALYERFGIDKQTLPRKKFGIYIHRTEQPTHPIVRGFDDEYAVPVSRHTGVARGEMEKSGEISILSSDLEDTQDVYLAAHTNRRLILDFNHAEYDVTTLADEYHRDTLRGVQINLPHNYVPENPKHSWRSHAHQLYGNWLNDVYQKTPYNLLDIGGS